jgi:hypothetical protein
VVNWADGYTSNLKGVNQTVSHRYQIRAGGYTLLPPGAYKTTAVFTNKFGGATAVPSGTITLKKDSWNPKVSVTKPKKPASAKSWKTITGTASDKGSGLNETLVGIIRVKGESVTCLNAKSKWITVTDANLLDCLRSVKVSKGKWSLKVPGLKKGHTIDVIAVVGDWSGRTNSAERLQTLTSN